MADHETFSDLLDKALEAIEENATTNPGPAAAPLRGIRTGFEDLDTLTGGLAPGCLYVIASRPGLGRTTLLSDICRSSAIAQSLPTAVYTLEDDRTRFAARIMSAEARIARHHIQNGLMTDGDWKRLAERMPRVNKAPLHVKTPHAITMDELAAEAAELVEKHGIRLLAVDGIQDIKPEKTSDLREREVGDVARGLKTLARQLSIPVVATSHLNRSPEFRDNKEPKLDDLRESGAITFAADLIILLHREDAYEKDSPRTGEADLIVAKHRHGPEATITVAFQSHYGRFVNMAPSC